MQKTLSIKDLQKFFTFSLRLPFLNMKFESKEVPDKKTIILISSGTNFNGLLVANDYLYGNEIFAIKLIKPSADDVLKGNGQPFYDEIMKLKTDSKELHAIVVVDNDYCDFVKDYINILQGHAIAPVIYLKKDAEEFNKKDIDAAVKRGNQYNESLRHSNMTK